MKPLQLKLPFLGLAIITIIAMSCSNDNNDDSVSYHVTQSDLDKVSNFIGDWSGGQMAHGGPDGTSPDSTVRSVYASMSGLDGSHPVGTIVTKQTFRKDASGKTDQMYVAFAMVKREAGYFADGGDWEYIMMPYDENVDYDVHPYGILPAEGNGRGQLASCAGCHSGAGGNDWLFVND